MQENQIPPGLRYIENIQLIGISKNIADIKLIHAIYRIFSVAVKSRSRNIWPSSNKKGKSLDLYSLL